MTIDNEQARNENKEGIEENADIHMSQQRAAYHDHLRRLMELYNRGQSALELLNKNYRRHDNSLARNLMADAKAKFNDLADNANITDETITNFLQYLQKKCDQYEQSMEEINRQKIEEERLRAREVEGKMEIDQDSPRIIKQEIVTETAEESVEEDAPRRTIIYRESEYCFLSLTILQRIDKD